MGEPVSIRTVRRIARLEGVDPAELHPPLYEAIDPEALDSLFDSADETDRIGSVTVEFEYCGYRVTVGVNGDVDVHDSTSIETRSPLGE